MPTWALRAALFQKFLDLFAQCFLTVGSSPSLDDSLVFGYEDRERRADKFVRVSDPPSVIETDRKAEPVGLNKLAHFGLAVFNKNTDKPNFFIFKRLIRFFDGRSLLPALRSIGRNKLQNCHLLLEFRKVESLSVQELDGESRSRIVSDLCRRRPMAEMKCE
jgi:hypothetical protein